MLIEVRSSPVKILKVGMLTLSSFSNLVLQRLFLYLVIALQFLLTLLDRINVHPDNYVYRSKSLNFLVDNMAVYKYLEIRKSNLLALESSQHFKKVINTLSGLSFTKQLSINMKQKVVIQLSMNGNDHKSRSKAFKIAVSQPGVESAAIQGQENNQLEVVGEQIDAVVLTNLLRKKLGLAEIVTFGPVAVGDKNKSQDLMVQWQPYNYQSHYVVPQYPVYEVRDSYQQGCSIM